LQQYILLQALLKPAQKTGREVFLNFYKKQARPPKAELRAKIISRSLEGLIDKEMLVGYGMRTPHKWFIKDVRLTAKGRAAAQSLLGEQMMLPI
jgi:hypothetical protein